MLCAMSHPWVKVAKLKTLLYSALVLLGISCSESKISERLHYIEAELDRSSYVHDSLRNELDSIMTFAHLSDREMALGQILKFRFQMVNHDNLDGSLADQALEYYNRHHDPRMLAWCHIARGVYLAHQLERYDESIMELKQAEELSTLSNDLVLKYYLYQFLEQANQRMQNYEKELKYSQRAFEYSRQLSDTLRLLVSLNNLATAYTMAYSANGNPSFTDSAKLCFKKSIPLVNHLTNQSSFTPYFLATLGGFYLNEHKMDSAYILATKSMQLRPTYLGCLLLASIAEELGNVVKADSLYQRTLSMGESDPAIVFSIGKVHPLKFYYNFKMRQGQYHEACQLMEQIVATKDSLNRARQVMVVNELQTKYDQEVKRRALDKNSIVIVLSRPCCWC